MGGRKRRGRVAVLAELGVGLVDGPGRRKARRGGNINACGGSPPIGPSRGAEPRWRGYLVGPDPFSDLDVMG
jgi:hypothetical protein